MNAATQIKKISTKTVYGNIALSKLMKAEGQRLRVMEVMGMAVSTKSDDSDYGTWTALQGTFEARNPATGEIFKSATCFLPDVALVPILVGLASAGARGVSFAIAVDVVYVAEKPGAKAGGSPYEYTFQEIMQPSEEEDPIARIKARISAQATPALPSPGVSADEKAELTGQGDPEPAPAKVKGRK